VARRSRARAAQSAHHAALAPGAAHRRGDGGLRPPPPERGERREGDGALHPPRAPARASPLTRRPAAREHCRPPWPAGRVRPPPAPLDAAAPAPAAARAAPAAPPAELEQRLAGLEARQSARVALGAILAAWRVPGLGADEADVPGQLEPIAWRRGLEVLPLTGNLSMLRLLDLPALLELRVPGATEPRYAGLLGVDDRGVVLS